MQLPGGLPCKITKAELNPGVDVLILLAYAEVTLHRLFKEPGQAGKKTILLAGA